MFLEEECHLISGFPIPIGKDLFSVFLVASSIAPCRWARKVLYHCSGRGGSPGPWRSLSDDLDLLFGN